MLFNPHAAGISCFYWRQHRQQRQREKDVLAPGIARSTILTAGYGRATRAVSRISAI